MSELIGADSKGEGKRYDIHLTDVPFAHLLQKPGDLTVREKTFVAAAEKWQQREGAYALIQGTKPRTLAYGLADSTGGAGRVDHRKVPHLE